MVAGSFHGGLRAQGQEAAGDGDLFQAQDVFGLEYASDPRISPDGGRVVYVRNFFDIMTDRHRSNLWMVAADGSTHRALTTGGENDGSPRWSPDGSRLLYVSTRDGSTQLWVRWLDTGQEARLTTLTRGPGSLSWSPDGRWIAFTQFVPVHEPTGLDVQLPDMPEGAEWTPAPRVVDDIAYRADGQGYLEDGYTHVFVVPAEGGTPRDLTPGPYDVGSPAWTPDGSALIVSSNHRDDRELEAQDSELWELSVADGTLTRLTDRYGPDGSPAVSPDGSLIAYTGYDDHLQGYQVARLYIMNRDGSGGHELAASLDRDVGGLTWAADGQGLFFQYDDEGDTRIGYVTLEGDVAELADGLGGTSYGRPYGGGSFTVARNGTFAYTRTSPSRPADVGVGRRGGQVRTVTDLNEDLLAHKRLGQVEELWWESSYDGRRVQGWLVTPPGFDPSRSYPLVLEIHGGPFSNYGPRFAAEIQLYAAAGNLVLYTNPRGSTSYGEEFGNLIHHAYPGHDYEDLMSGVDAVIDRGIVDTDHLYVTGGSGGGVLTAWIVGKTDRFRAAVVQKPVINWSSFVLHADGIPFFARYWFGAKPWEDPEQYWSRSPLSLAGNVTTPTMLIDGEQDYRTPISETEQYYAAMKLQGVPTMMVRIAQSGHNISARPSNMIRKVAYVLAWFRRWADADAPVSDR